MLLIPSPKIQERGSAFARKRDVHETCHLRSTVEPTIQTTVETVPAAEEATVPATATMETAVPATATMETAAAGKVEAPQPVETVRVPQPTEMVPAAEVPARGETKDAGKEKIDGPHEALQPANEKPAGGAPQPDPPGTEKAPLQLEALSTEEKAAMRASTESITEQGQHLIANSDLLEVCMDSYVSNIVNFSTRSCDD